jgi:hypothetical protein
MHISRKLIAALLAGITALPAHELMAQFRGGGGFPGGGTGGMRGGKGRDAPADGVKEQRPAARENRADQSESVMEELRQDLKLAPGQQAAWQAYIDKVKAYAADMARERSRGQVGVQKDPPQQMDALQQIERSIDGARNRLAGLEDIVLAARALYDSLSPEQKAVADARLAKIIPATAGATPAITPETPGRRKIPQ